MVLFGDCILVIVVLGVIWLLTPGYPKRFAR